MARKFLTPIDLSGLELLNARLQNLAAEPGNAGEGRIFFHTGLGKVGIFAGGVFRYLGEGGAVESLDDVPDSATRLALTPEERAKLAGIQDGATANDDAYLLDLGNHTGTLTADRISDLNAVLAALTLDSFADPVGPVSMGGQQLTNLAEPTQATDAATKAYVDAARQGLDVKDSARAATTGDIALTGTQTVDDVALTAGDRVLVKAQADATQNGIYVVADGAWARAADFDDVDVTPGAFVFIEEGTANGDTGWVLTTDGDITVGVTALAFTQFSGAGSLSAGAGLTQSGGSLDVGAGNGILVGPDSISVDPAVVTRKFATSIGDAAATSYVVTHNLNTRDVQVTLYDNATYETVEADVERTSVNTVTVRFAVAPAAGAYRVLVQG